MGESAFHFICSVILNSLLNVPTLHTLTKYTPEKAAFHALHVIRKLGPHFLNVLFYFLIVYQRNSLLGVGSLVISHLSGSVAAKVEMHAQVHQYISDKNGSLICAQFLSILVTNGLKQVELTYSPVSLSVVSSLQASFQMILRAPFPPINFLKQIYQS